MVFSLSVEKLCHFYCHYSDVCDGHCSLVCVCVLNLAGTRCDSLSSVFITPGMLQLLLVWKPCPSKNMIWKVLDLTSLGDAMGFKPFPSNKFQTLCHSVMHIGFQTCPSKKIMMQKVLNLACILFGDAWAGFPNWKIQKHIARVYRQVIELFSKPFCGCGLNTFVMN